MILNYKIHATNKAIQKIVTHSISAWLSVEDLVYIHYTAHLMC